MSIFLRDLVFPAFSDSPGTARMLASSTGQLIMVSKYLPGVPACVDSLVLQVKLHDYRSGPIRQCGHLGAIIMGRQLEHYRFWPPPH